jgi:hypothetical protein
LVARLGLQVQTTRAEAPPWSGETADARSPSGERSRARVWIDARPRDRVDVVVSVARGGSFDPPVSRSVPRTDATEAILVERVSLVVHATLESLLAPPEPEKAPSGSASVPAAPPPAGADREASRAPNARFGLDAAAFASCAAVAPSSGALFGGGVSLDLLLRRVVLRPSLWLGAAILESFDTQGQVLVLETNVSSFRAVPSVQLLELSALEVDFGAGVGLDLFHTIPRDAARATVQLFSTKTLGDPILEGLLVSRIRIARGARLLVGIALDYDFGEHRYTAIDRFGNPTAVVLEPWALRPSAMLGLCIPLAGASACASAE